jgi:hypothetical protein
VSGEQRGAEERLGVALGEPRGGVARSRVGRRKEVRRVRFFLDTGGCQCTTSGMGKFVTPLALWPLFCECFLVSLVFYIFFIKLSGVEN